MAAKVLAYAFLDLDALGDTLEDPFALGPDTLPPDAMPRMLVTGLLQALGLDDLPPPLQPVGHVLT